jgi:hypothetical protein
MLLELLGQERRKHQRPHARFALRRSEHELTVGQLLLLLFDGNRVMEQVHVASLQAEQLTDAQTDEARNQHEDPVAVADCTARHNAGG